MHPIIILIGLCVVKSLGVHLNVSLQSSLFIIYWHCTVHKK